MPSTAPLLVFVTMFAANEAGGIQAFHLDTATGTLTPVAFTAGQKRKNGASHQIWVSSQIAQIWWLAPFPFRSARQVCERLEAVRPLLEHAATGNEPRLVAALRAEEEAEREADRHYWAPLKQELEQLRHAR